MFDDYVLKHRRMAAREEPAARFHLPAPGSPYPASSLPALLAQKGVEVHRPERGDAYEMALFEAFFGRSEDVSDPEVLARLGERAGVDAEEVRAYLRDARLEQLVFEEHREALEQFAVRGIPTVIVSGLPPIVGAVPREFYRGALRAAVEGRAFTPPGGGRLPTV